MYHLSAHLLISIHNQRSISFIQWPKWLFANAKKINKLKFALQRGGQCVRCRIMVLTWCCWCGWFVTCEDDGASIFNADECGFEPELFWLFNLSIFNSSFVTGWIIGIRFDCRFSVPYKINKIVVKFLSLVMVDREWSEYWLVRTIFTCCWRCGITYGGCRCICWLIWWVCGWCIGIGVLPAPATAVSVKSITNSIAKLELIRILCVDRFEIATSGMFNTYLLAQYDG